MHESLALEQAAGMLVNGPLPITPNDQVGRTDFTFRPYQRVVAEVLQVTATQAILSVDGTPIVARLTSSDQAAALREQRQARFIVTQAGENTVHFKLVTSNQSGNIVDMSGARLDLLGRFLADINAAASAKNITLAQAMLNQKLPLSPEIFHELSGVLAQLGDWEPGLADLASAIKAAGLPLTPDSLALAARETGGAEVLDTLYQLIKNAVSRESLPEGFRSLLDSAAQLLDEARAAAGSPRELLARSLENQVILNGRSLENILLEQADGKNPFWPEKSLVLLARLHSMAESLGEHEISREITRYLEQNQQAQFWNIHTGQARTVKDWLEVPLYIQTQNAQGEAQTEPAHLRIMRNIRESEQKIDPGNTRLTIEMEVAPGKTVQVNLSLTGKQAWPDVVVEDEQLLDAARLELPGLETGMQQLGYGVNQSSLRVGKSESGERARAARPNLVTLTIDLEA